MSLAVTVPLITGSQTECGEAGHLAYCTRDSRQQWVMMQTTQLSHQQIMHTCSMYGQHLTLPHVGKNLTGLLIQPENISNLSRLRRLDQTNSDVARSRTLLEIKDEPGKIIHSSCRVPQREWERGALICFHVRVPVRPCGDRPGL